MAKRRYRSRYRSRGNRKYMNRYRMARGGIRL